LQNRSGAQILINQDFPPGTPREVTLIGTPSQIQAAQQMVDLIIAQGPAAVHMLDGPIITTEVTCPQKLIGRVIGSQGHTIKEVETRCGVKIQIHQDVPIEGGDRRISVTGNETALAQARSLLQYIMINGGLDTPAAPTPASYLALAPMAVPMPFAMPMHASVPLLSSPQTQVVEVPKTCLGRIIGKGGETVNQIQARSGTRIHIEQSVPPGAPCRIHITGERTGIEVAMRQLREVATGPLPPRSSSLTAAAALPAVSLFPQLHLPRQTVVSSPSMPLPSYGTAALAPLPPHWTEHLTNEGHVYWYNSATSVSQVRLSPSPLLSPLLSPLMFSSGKGHSSNRRLTDS
jgi:rRNA processing protein Krr1/Pno1